MMSIRVYKQMLNIFQQYGIQTTGNKKFASFNHDLKMDPVFVLGLIYELELVSKRQLGDEQIPLVNSPARLVDLLAEVP